MIYQFKTESDDELFVLDTINRHWGRASSILATPSVETAKSHIARFVYSEEGNLIAEGGGGFVLDGRYTNKDGPGAGLNSVVILSVPFDVYHILILKPSVRVKKGSFVSGYPEEYRKNVVQHRIWQPNEAFPTN